jgi:type I restriction enzyme, S subunit
VVDARYLFHWLNADATQAKIRNCGRQTTNISNLSSKQFLGLVLPRPPLVEQQRIAAVLDKADSLSRKRHEAIQLANDLLRAVFMDMYGDPVINPKRWPVYKMGDVIDFKGGSQPPKETFVDEARPGYVRLVQIRDFKTDKYKTFIPAHLAKREFDVDDVMIARYGPPVFQILRGLSGSYNVALMKAQPKADILKEIIYWLLQLPAYHDVVVANSERTAGQSGVNLDLLNKLLVPLPPPSVQLEIAKQTTRITALIKKQEEMLRLQEAQCKALQASLLG